VKILHVAPSFYPALVYGGPIRSLYDLCRALSALGEDVRVLTTDANGPARVEAPRGREVSLAVAGGQDVAVRYARRLAGHTISAEFLRVLPGYVRWADVVHLTAIYSFPTFPTLAITRTIGKPVVVSPRGSFGAWGQARGWWKKAPLNAALRRLAARGVTFHATAEAEAEDIGNVMGPVATAVIPNGVDAEEFATLPTASATWIRNAVSLKPDDGPLVGCLGRIHAKKGLDSLVRALPRLVQRWPRLHALLAGPDAGAQAPLTEAARALGLGNRVHFLGGVYGRERISFLSGLDVFVLPSLDENFGNAIAEALAAGAPVVASRQCPWPELESHRCGRWIAPEPGDIAEAIEAILLDDGPAMGRRGRDFVLSERTMTVAAERMRDLYRKVVRPSRPPRS
jgi:glycosyltransferase involved in cell wall biosynthesis